MYTYIPLQENSIFHCNFELKDRYSTILKTLPTFYQKQIELWCKISYQEPADVTQICNQSLLDNGFIVGQGKPNFNIPFINKSDHLC